MTHACTCLSCQNERLWTKIRGNLKNEEIMKRKEHSPNELNSNCFGNTPFIVLNWTEAKSFSLFIENSILSHFNFSVQKFIWCIFCLEYKYYPGIFPNSANVWIWVYLFWKIIEKSISGLAGLIKYMELNCGREKFWAAFGVEKSRQQCMNFPAIKIAVEPQYVLEQRTACTRAHLCCDGVEIYLCPIHIVNELVLYQLYDSMFAIDVQCLQKLLRPKHMGENLKFSECGCPNRNKIPQTNSFWIPQKKYKKILNTGWKRWRRHSRRWNGFTLCQVAHLIAFFICHFVHSLIHSFEWH